MAQLLDIRIAEFDYAHEVELAKLYLGSLGIPSRIQGSLAAPNERILIFVSADDAVRAQSLLEQHRASSQKGPAPTLEGGSFAIGFLLGSIVGLPVLLFAVNRIRRPVTRNGFWCGLTVQAALLLTAKSLLTWTRQ